MANERQWTGSCANVPESLRALALEFMTKAYAARDELKIDSGAERSDVDRALAELSAYLIDHAATLSEWGDAVEQLYARLDEGEIVTNAQGVALAGFLRRGFRTAVPAYRWANVAQGGMGLPNTYLSVRMADGFEGGIDQEGRVST